jgi:hypothetical protein
MVKPIAMPTRFIAIFFISCNPISKMQYKAHHRHSQIIITITHGLTISINLR